MSFIAVLKKVGQIAGIAAPQVIATVNPAVGALAGTVLQSILLAEARVGPGNGEAKKEQALGAMQVALPLMIQLMEARTGRTLADGQLLAAGFEKMNDGLVDILNAFRILPKA